jgi:hypothetical protein
VDAEIVFLSVYLCPGCGTELEAGEGMMDQWLRCPKCGRPSLPPTDGITRSRPREPYRRRDLSPDQPGGELLIISAQPDTAPSARSGLKALWVLAGVAISVLICSLLLSSPVEIILVGAVTSVVLILLIQTWGRS